jgi:hypothetical protein
LKIKTETFDSNYDKLTSVAKNSWQEILWHKSHQT